MKKFLKYIGVFFFIGLNLVGCSEKQDKTPTIEQTTHESGKIDFTTASKEQLLTVAKEVMKTYEEMLTTTSKDTYDILRSNTFEDIERFAPDDYFGKYIDASVEYSNEQIVKQEDDFIYEYDVFQDYTLVNEDKEFTRGRLSVTIKQFADGYFRIIDKNHLQ